MGGTDPTYFFPLRVSQLSKFYLPNDTFLHKELFNDIDSQKPNADIGINII